jgi:YD repeat-containing protein
MSTFHMKILSSLLVILFAVTADAQYYYNDIISIQQGNEQYKALRAGKIRKISATSFEADNTPTDGFLLEQDISLDGKKIVLSTTTSGGKSSVTTRNYELSKLKRTQTVSGALENRADYSYNDKGQLQKVVLTTTDTATKYATAEAHEWAYDSKGQPDFMLKIKNRLDTTHIEFVKDEKGQIVEEHWKKNNRNQETYYYYYDAAGRLSDIVRYNLRLKKLIPDFQYEYDSTGRLSQMTQISLGSANYNVWKYQYKEKGLKGSEAGYDKQKSLVGRIEYRYE